jgi:DNA polymerase-3 subunit epsilon
VTEAERRDLHTVAQLLAIDAQNLDALLDVAGEKLTDVRDAAPISQVSPLSDNLVGKRVCFTGECICQYDGGLITRGIATQLASERGLIVQESVTKGLDILIVADPESQSGKARKARQYGIPILPELVFWRNIGVVIK